MIYNREEREIILKRELSELDKFVLDFCKLLKEYVIVSGYVSILLGRSRATEDVDLLIPKINRGEFEELWIKLYKNNFECINTLNSDEAFEMLKEHAIRFFCKKKRPIPNIEFKFIKTNLDEYSFQNKIKVILNKDILFVSPIEMQIAFKLFLASDGEDYEISSDKDIEDARHLYKTFKENINKKEMLNIITKLGVGKKLKWLQ